MLLMAGRALGAVTADAPTDPLKRQCTYTAVNTSPGYTVRLSVTNECNMTDYDEANVRVTATP